MKKLLTALTVLAAFAVTPVKATAQIIPSAPSLYSIPGLNAALNRVAGGAKYMPVTAPISPTNAQGVQAATTSTILSRTSWEVLDFLSDPVACWSDFWPSTSTIDVTQGNGPGGNSVAGMRISAAIDWYPGTSTTRQIVQLHFNGSQYGYVYPGGTLVSDPAGFEVTGPTNGTVVSASSSSTFLSNIPFNGNTINGSEDYIVWIVRAHGANGPNMPAGMRAPLTSISNSGGFVSVVQNTAYTDGTVPTVGDTFSIRHYVHLRTYSVCSGQVQSPAAMSSLTGGSLTAATYYYYITALNPWGESIDSTEVNSGAITGITGSCALTWAAPLNGFAASYNIYRGTSSGAERYLVAVPGTSTSYTDTGALAPNPAIVTPTTSVYIPSNRNCQQNSVESATVNGYTDATNVPAGLYSYPSNNNGTFDATAVLGKQGVQPNPAGPVPLPATVVVEGNSIPNGTGYTQFYNQAGPGSWLYTALSMAGDPYVPISAGASTTAGWILSYNTPVRHAWLPSGQYDVLLDHTNDEPALSLSIQTGYNSTTNITSTGAVVTVTTAAAMAANAYNGTLFYATSGPGAGTVAVVTANTALSGGSYTVTLSQAPGTALTSASTCGIWVMNGTAPITVGYNNVTGISSTGAVVTTTGSGYTVNAYAGQLFAVVYGTGKGQTGYVASNTATALTMTANLATALDSTSVLLLSQVEANILTACQQCWSRGGRPVITTSLPKNASIDGWMTWANEFPSPGDLLRQATNAWERAGCRVSTVTGQYVNWPAASGVQYAYGPAVVLDPASLVEYNSAGVRTLNGGYEEVPNAALLTIANGVGGVTAVSSSSTVFTVTGTLSTPWTAGEWVGDTVFISSGTGSGLLYISQITASTASSGTTQTFTVQTAPGVAADSTSHPVIYLGSQFDGVHPSTYEHWEMSIGEAPIIKKLLVRQ